MEQHIIDLITTTKKQYANNYSYMLRDYNQENETVKGYNGRQLLELLQNCDDEGSKEVLIKLDQEKRQISIHNIGNPFSKNGYRSLFISNLSSKTEQKKYIGNKGLGFRSIINWSNAIEIQSNDLSLCYSEENRKINFKTLFDDETQLLIQKEQNLKDHVYPLPFLTLPDVTRVQQNGYITSIIIDYKLNFLKDIVKQIRAITPETILFLNNIENIKFEGLIGKENISCAREIIHSDSTDFKPQTNIRFTSGTNWQIFEKEALLPKKYWDELKQDEEFYQIKIAIEENFEVSSSNLYSFFPTKIQLKQPYILHATFDLDSTRNQINDSDKNRYILKKIAKFTIKVAKYFSKINVSYKPLEILHHAHEADTLSDLGYYDLINEAINTEAILPCVNNTYKTVADSIFISNHFGQMLIDIQATNNVNCHILPLEYRDLSDYNLQDKLDNSLSVLKNVVDVINSISDKELTINQRANFIFQIVANCEFLATDHENQMNFLVNDDLVNIKKGEYIYTPITKENSLKTPSYTNIQFLNKILFDKLLEIFGFNDDENSNKSRFIYDRLKGFCNIHSYEPATLAQKIISECRNRLKSHPSLSHATVKEMNQCLFHNFLQLNDDTKLPGTIRVPGISKNEKIRFVDEMVLSDEYPKGKITETIFSDIYKTNDFIGSPQGLGLPGQNTYKIQDYLKWLGLNEFAQYEIINSEEFDLDSYRIYLSNELNVDIDSRIKAKVSGIKGLYSIIKHITVEKLILWIYFDGKIRSQLNDSDNDDYFQYFYRTWNYFITKPSYIKYQVQKFGLYNFSDYLIEEKYSWVNDFSIDYRKDFFKEHEVSKSQIDSILVMLGAKDDFSDLSIEKMAAIINKLPERYPNGKKTQTIYKKALGHYNKHKLHLNTEVMLFADDGVALKAFPQSEIYFSDNIKLPKPLLKNFPVFNFPARSGGVEAIEFFGINDLSDIEIQLTSSKLIPELNKEFNYLFELLKPIILTYRISAIEESKIQKVQAAICNKIEIVLCSEVQYKIGEESFEVLDYEFIHYKDQTYYIKVDKNDNLSALQSKRAFTNSCADIISLSFDVRGDRNEFRHLFSGQYDDTLKNIKVDFGEDTYNEARELLGLADYKQAFWQAIFISKGIEYQVHMDDLKLESLLRRYFNIEIDLNFLEYESVNERDAVLKIQNLFDEINLDLKAFSKNYIYSFSLADFHYSNIKNALISKKTLIKSVIWKKLENLTINEKSEYLNLINDFENYHNFVEEVSERYKLQFDIDMENLFLEYLEKLYGNLDLTTQIDVSSIRDQNAESFDNEELHKIAQSERLKSLLYFTNALSTIKEEINKAVESFPNNTSEENHTNSNKPKVIDSKNLKHRNRDLKNKKKGVYLPKDSHARRLKEIGDTSEKFVYDYLKKNNFNNVDWASRDNEGLYCDIRFTDENGNVKYIEVKTFDANRFFLTSSEFDFGLSEKDHYEIWLVRNKTEIIKIKDFFTNSKYDPIASEYIIQLDFVKYSVKQT